MLCMSLFSKNENENCTITTCVRRFLLKSVQEAGGVTKAKLGESDFPLFFGINSVIFLNPMTTWWCGGWQPKSLRGSQTTAQIFRQSYYQRRRYTFSGINQNILPQVILQGLLPSRFNRNHFLLISSPILQGCMATFLIRTTVQSNKCLQDFITHVSLVPKQWT